MLRKIDSKGDKEIWKASTTDRKTGAEIINFYGIRGKDMKDKPFDSQHGTLRDAREALTAA